MTKYPGDSDNAGLSDALKSEAIDQDLLTTLSAITKSIVDIGVSLREGKSGFASKTVGTQNAFGDNQLEVDVASDKAVFERLKQSQVVSVASSEETTTEVNCGGDKYCVAFDPLDGSSIVDANFAVGSIFGVWPGTTLLNRKGNELSAACMAMYGPRISLALAYRTKDGFLKSCELTFIENCWQITKENLSIAESGKTFAPGNLRATFDNEKYNKLVQFWIKNKYTLRYSGGMVPDVYHILFKGKGVFTNCSSDSAKAKLRLLYECAPIAFIVEASNGKSLVDPRFAKTPTSVLDIVIDDLDKRIGICYGGTEEVKIFQKFMFE